jgi:propanediol utilization protein
VDEEEEDPNMIVADDEGWEEVEVKVEPDEEDMVPVDSDEANAMSDIDNDYSDA